MKRAVKVKGQTLSFALGNARMDREVVLAAVTQHGLALEFAPPEMQAKYAIVLAAVQKNGLALKFASQTMQANREIVLQAVKNNRQAFQYASETLYGDREILLELGETSDLQEEEGTFQRLWAKIPQLGGAGSECARACKIGRDDMCRVPLPEWANNLSERWLPKMGT